MSVLDLSFTSGQFYVIGYWLSAVICISVSPRRIRGFRLYSTEAAFLVLMNVYAVISVQHREWWFWLKVAVCMLILLVFIYITCLFKPAELIFCFCEVYLFGEFATSLEWQLYYYGTEINIIRPTAWNNYLFLAVVFTILFPGYYLMIRKLYKEGLNTVKKCEAALSCIICAATSAGSNLGYLIGNTPFSSGKVSDIYRIRTLFDLCGVCILFAYHLMLMEAEKRASVSALKNMMELQYRNYKMSEACIDLINQKYHDLKHQITILKMQTSEGKNKDTLSQLEGELSDYAALAKTGNSALDIILTEKNITCQRKNIRIMSIIDGSAMDFMDIMDLAALFGNALDNAIEATEKLSEEEKKIIHFRISRKNSFVRISIVNPYIGKLEYKNGVPLSMKEQKDYHGFGVKSMQSVVKKYDGTMTIDEKDQNFILSILFPV